MKLAFFKTCIFCNTPLPNLRGGEGEHVIPERIFGYWRSYDICDACRTAFGNEVDQLATQSVPILNAMEHLGIRNTDPHLDNLKWSAEDATDGHKVQVVKRGERFRPKVVKADTLLECSEDDLDTMAKGWLWDLTRSFLSDESFEAEYAKFRREYIKLSPGQYYHSEVFHCFIRRGQLQNVKATSPTPKDITRLIAKIVTFFIHNAFSLDMLATIEEYDELKRHARYGDALKPFTINRLRPLHEARSYPFHRVAVYPDKRVTLVDTTFFGSVGWRTVLKSTTPLTVGDLHRDDAQYMFLLLDFSRLKSPRKYLCYKFPDQKVPVEYEVLV